MQEDPEHSTGKRKESNFSIPRYGPSSVFLLNVFFALKGSKPFYSYLLSLQLVLYHVAAGKNLPTLIYSADYILLLNL